MSEQRLNSLSAVLRSRVRTLPVSTWAHLLGVHRTSIYYHINHGRLVPKKILGADYVHLSGLVGLWPDVFRKAGLRFRQFGG